MGKADLTIATKERRVWAANNTQPVQGISSAGHMVLSVLEVPEGCN
jgi:hypothetical protein